MDVKEFVRKPFFVQAVQITPANMQEVAEWCGGTIEHMAAKPSKDLPAANYIAVPVAHPVTVRQTQGFAGDWVCKAGAKNFKVYTNKAFRGSFDLRQVEETVSQ